MNIDICFCSDKNLIEHIPTVVNSILRKNSQHDLTIHLIHNIEKVELLEDLSIYCNKKGLSFKEYRKSWDYHYDSPLKGSITEATMLRLFIPELIEVEKLIYLDIDLLVNTDLEPLMNLDTGDTGIAIKNSIYTSWKKGKSGKQSGNCGVMVMNNTKLIENDFTNKCLEFFNSKEYGRKLHDQDLINLYCDGNHSKLPSQYNVYIGQDQQLINEHKDHILHFAGSKKPYKRNTPLGRKFKDMWEENKYNPKQEAISFGVTHYKNQFAGGASSNIGDYVQTLAQINIYRKFVEEYNDVEYPFEKFLDDVNKNRVENFNFVFIKRDDMKSSPNLKGFDNVITIMNGWWMHPINYNKGIAFDVPKEVNPIFTSFHIANEKLYWNTNVDKFKKFQPIGCRDKKTTEKLADKGVETFFSGCLTTTIDFLEYDKKNDDIHIVDTKGIGVKSSQMNPKWKNIDPRKGLVQAYEMLKKYSMCSEVKTSRLHCYLPCLAMGVPVTFQSPEGDGKKTWGSPNRFDGLFELKDNPEEFNRIRDDLTEYCLEEIRNRVDK